MTHHKDMGLTWKPDNAYSILWPDKSTLNADSPGALLDRLASIQWQPCSRQQMKDRLSDRAAAWSGTVIDEYQPDLDFLLACEGAGLFVIVGPAT